MSFEWKKVLLFAVVISVSYFIFSFLLERATRDLGGIGFLDSGRLLFFFILPIFVIVLFIVVGVIALRRFQSKKVIHVSLTFILGAALILVPSGIMRDTSSEKADEQHIMLFDEMLMTVQQALAQNNVGACDQIPGLVASHYGAITPFVCRGMVAAKTGDLDVCACASEPFSECYSGLSFACLSAAASITEDSSICRLELDGLSTNERKIDECISQSSKNVAQEITGGGLGGASYCQRMRGARHDLCIADMAWKLNNPSLCDRIDETTYPSAEGICRLRFDLREQVQRL
ncbi:hypothetical protein CL629_04165 [bacterium]|nr:hypothetical protein [bacterium]|tara:strand:+ start:567 stop:1433 length:867 start_codon:yes stop_codon:yes gene_type:complete